MNDNPQEMLMCEMKLTQRLRAMNDNLSAKCQRLEKENEKQAETIECYKAMKEGVQIRIAKLEACIAKLDGLLEEALKFLPTPLHKRVTARDVPKVRE